MINISKFLINGVYTNCYLLTDSKTGDMTVIDPGGESRELLNAVESSKGVLRYILLTHGHYDHIMYVAELERRYHPLICVSEIEKPLIEDGSINDMGYSFFEIDRFDIDKGLKDGEEISFGDRKIRFMLTPGHTAGSGIYILDDVIFSGDTVFCNSVGRCDLPTGDMNMMNRSLEKISSLKGDYRILPGHDRETTLDIERRFNPFFP